MADSGVIRACVELCDDLNLGGGGVRTARGSKATRESRTFHVLVAIGTVTASEDEASGEALPEEERVDCRDSDHSQFSSEAGSSHPACPTTVLPGLW
jgi:hypothetical protein